MHSCFCDAIALSAGGTAGTAHVGSLTALFALDKTKLFQIRHWAGSSVGSLIALFVFLCRGNVPEIKRICNLMCTNPNNVLRMDVFTLVTSLGLDTMQQFHMFLTDLCKKKMNHANPTLSEISKHWGGRSLGVVVTNLTDLEHGMQYFSSMNPDVASKSVIELVLQSCSAPVFFQPTIEGSNVYTDGGILNYCPMWEVCGDALSCKEDHCCGARLKNKLPVKVLGWVYQPFGFTVAVPQNSMEMLLTTIWRLTWELCRRRLRESCTYSQIPITFPTIPQSEQPQVFKYSKENTRAVSVHFSHPPGCSLTSIPGMESMIHRGWSIMARLMLKSEDLFNF